MREMRNGLARISSRRVCGAREKKRKHSLRTFRWAYSVGILVTNFMREKEDVGMGELMKLNFRDTSSNMRVVIFNFFYLHVFYGLSLSLLHVLQLTVSNVFGFLVTG